jgi:hypothetical protein
MDKLMSVIPALILLTASGAIYLFREAIKAWLTKGVSHHFDRQIETLRADLKSKEEKINSLRQSALSGAGKRREALDKRQLEAIDKLWAAVIDLGQLKTASQLMVVIDFEASKKSVGKNENSRRFFETIAKPFDISKMPHNDAEKERPFVSDKAWAFFNAYRAILYYALMQIKTLEIGGDAPKFLKHKHIDDLVKAALPHQTVNMEKFGTSFCHHLVDELERTLLKTLKDDLDGSKASAEDIQIAAQILSASESIIAKLDEDAKNGV